MLEDTTHMMHHTEESKIRTITIGHIQDTVLPFPAFSIALEWVFFADSFVHFTG